MRSKTKITSKVNCSLLIKNEMKQRMSNLHDELRKVIKQRALDNACSGNYDPEYILCRSKMYFY